ncbi:MAG TPA: hypothetical protein VHL14_02050, partial [Steroidobacteraceae bacterium]|nr:hypothetical protein [Steroidobacteraceae bacterium]
VDSMTVANSRQRGIYMQGANLTITNNKIMTTRGKTNVAGIYLFSGYPSITASNRAVIQGNTIFNTNSLASDPQNSASAYGIYAAGFVDLLIRDNSVFNTWVKANTTTYSSAAGIMINQMLGVCAQACATDPVGGLVVQDNNVSNSIVITRTASPNLTGIQISYPGDHAIVSGSKIMLMNTGIDVGNSWGSWPNTPPVLLLNNTITSAITPIVGGVTLPQ